MVRAAEWVSEIYSGHGGVALSIQVVAPTAGEGQSEKGVQT